MYANSLISRSRTTQSRHLSPEKYHQHSLLRSNPLLCGLFQFKIYLLLQQVGVDLCVALESIVTVAHLYQDCLRGGSVTGIGQTWRSLRKFTLASAFSLAVSRSLRKKL